MLKLETELETTMTDDRMTLLELVEKDADCDLVREMLAFAAERLMDAEVEETTGAAKGARSPLRAAQRNGYPPVLPASYLAALFARAAISAHCAMRASNGSSSSKSSPSSTMRA